MTPSDIPALLARIAAEDGAIGSFWQVDDAGALVAAKASAARRAAGTTLGPLDGIAIAVKDNVDVAGLRTTAGIAAFRHAIAQQDAPVVRRLRQAGMVILGKAAMHEGALGATTDTPGFGRCMNPLRTGYTPGGSSGGSGAAVAAGFAPLAIGTDTMGSVRLPAAYCGVVGLKPTAGLVGRSGVVPLSPRLDHVGVLARTLEAAALGLEAIAGDDPDDPEARPTPAGWRALPSTPANPRGLRIGLPESVQAAPMEGAVRTAWEDAQQRLREAGATLTPVAVPGWDLTASRRAGLLLIEAEAAALHPALIEDAAAATPEFRAALAYGRDAGAVRLVKALFRLAEVKAGALRALDDCDLLLMPTAPQRAFAHGTPAPVDQADFTALANIAGLPSIALPWPASDGGLPCSIQLVGPAYAEQAICALAAWLVAAVRAP